MPEILGNIYDRSIATVFGTVFFSSFWRLWKLISWQKIFQNVMFMFSFDPKNNRTGSRKTSITQELLVTESCPTLRWVTFLIFFRLVYDIFSHLNQPVLAQSTGQPPKFKGQPPKGQPPKFKGSVWNVPISQTGSKCNLTGW